MRRAIVRAALLVALSSPAVALTIPQPCGSDRRIRCAVYDPMAIVAVWSTPGALIDIQLADDETINADADIANNDTVRIITKSNANHLYIKFARCVQIEPVNVSTVTASGERRTYHFQVESKPPICKDPDPGLPAEELVKLASASKDPPLPGIANFAGNLHLPPDALGPDADVIYAVKFRYPAAEAAVRTKKAAERRSHNDQREAEELLKREVDLGTTDPWYGNRNIRYVTRGAADLKPTDLWDNGFLTAIVIGTDEMPILYKVLTHGRCTNDSNREEQQAQYSVHGNTIVANGKAQQWVLRNGLTKAHDICNLAYTPARVVPDTGTASPRVKRVIKRRAGG